jgi:PHD/YefM family antitoxin component YafN of YafNO toxin-antitoxin module
MMTITSIEAQSDFEKLLDTAQHQPVAITRNGQVAAILVSPQEMPLLQEWEAARIHRLEAEAKFDAYFGEAQEPRSQAASGDVENSGGT